MNAPGILPPDSDLFTRANADGAPFWPGRLLGLVLNLISLIGRPSEDMTAVRLSAVAFLNTI